MNNRKVYFLIFVLSLILVSFNNAFSKIYNFDPFGIKYSKSDIEKQRELFKNAKVKLAIIGQGDAEKVSVDKEGKILKRESHSDDESDFFEDTYIYNSTGQLIQIKSASGEYEENNLTYDDNGNLKKLTYLYLPAEIYQYDVNNNVSQIDFESTTSSVCPSIVLKYDEYNRLIERNEPCCDGSFNKTSTYSYDGNGNIYEIITNYSDCNFKNKSFHKTKLSYNLQGHLVRVDYSSSDGSTHIENITYEYYK